MENLRTSTREYINQAHHLMQNIYPAFLLDLQYLVSKDRGSNYKQGLDEAIGWMRRQLLPLNCEIELFDDGVHGKNLVARMKGTGKGKWVIFGHMDTVWEQGTTKEWHYETQDNIATGPGVVDNTGGTLAGLYTLKILHELGFDRFEEIIFINNSDEEIESPSSKPVFLEVAKGADYAICLESSSFADEIIGERAGAANFYIKVYGKGAHTGVSPEEGIDAGLEIAMKILEMFKVKGEDHVLYTSVVYIRAGSEINSVCDYAEAKLFVRVKSWQEFEMVKRKFQEIVDTSYVPGSRSTLEVDMNHGPMERLPGSEKLSSTIIDVAKSINLELKDVWCGGCADSSFTSQVGVPTMCGIGPFGQKYHTQEELLDLSSIVPRVTTVVGTIITLSASLNQV